MLYLLGLNHRSAPIEVRERLHFTKDELARILPDLVVPPAVAEAMIISTCNRTEFVAAVKGTEEAAGAVHSFLERRRPAEVEAVDRHAYTLVELDAVRHLFRVAASLDSMILGEPQILGQVKEAYATAVEAGTAGPALAALMQRAFSCAKRVRTDTQIAKNPVSIAYAAAELAEKIFGSLEGRTIMILGAGEMSELAARHLLKAGVRSVFVANRTYHKALELAREFNGEAVNFDRFLDYLPNVDIVISSTAAPHYILKAEQGPAIMKARRHRPLFVVDIAVPRDVDPALNDLDNLFLYNIDNLQSVVDAGMAERLREAAVAEELIDQEVRAYAAWLRSLAVKPTIVDLRRRFQQVAESEVRRLQGKLGGLDAKQQQAVQELVQAIINKLLHPPTTELKRALENPDGFDLVAMARRLFDLGEAEMQVPGEAGAREAGGPPPDPPPRPPESG